MILPNLLSNNISLLLQSTANPPTSQLREHSDRSGFQWKISVKISGELYSSTKLCYVTGGHSEDKTQRCKDANTVLRSNTGGLIGLPFMTAWFVCAFLTDRDIWHLLLPVLLQLLLYIKLSSWQSTSMRLYDLIKF